MSRIDNIVEQVLALDVQLTHARVRLAARADEEALHDLRSGLRRLRSLLRPLRRFGTTAALEQDAAAVGRLTTPARDLEVLVAELHRRGMAAVAGDRQAALQAAHSEVERSPLLDRLFESLAQWPRSLRAAERAGELEAVKRLVEKHLARQLKRLREALADPAHDRHRLRIQAKRTRYAVAAYPELSPLAPAGARLLRQVQASLGDWHDRHQMLLCAAERPDLAPLAQAWAGEAEAALLQAEGQLAKLSALL